MKLDRQLTLGDRYQIQALFNNNQSVRAMAKQLGKAPSTISRELSKGKVGKNYSAKRAEKVTRTRRQPRYEKLRVISDGLETYVRKQLYGDWSPQQIVERLKERGSLAPCSLTIYRYIERDKKLNGKLWKRLRILRKERNDRKVAQWYRRQGLPDRVMIDERPAVVLERKRLGDYERDTVFGKANGPLLLSMVDRTSRLVKISWLPAKNAELVHQATVARLKNELVHTITNDNGTEFSEHKRTAKSLKAAIYFSQAYRSWERGTNENTNGLIRQYFPRRTAIPKPPKGYIRRIENLLNNRPRKCLGYKTPNEIHRKLKTSGVAL